MESVGSTRSADRRLEDLPAPAYLDRALLLLAVCRRGSRWHVYRSLARTLGSWKHVACACACRVTVPGVLELSMHHRFYLAPPTSEPGAKPPIAGGGIGLLNLNRAGLRNLGHGGHGIWGAMDMRTNTGAIPVGLFWVPALDLRRIDQGFERRGCSGPKNRPGGMGGLRKTAVTMYVTAISFATWVETSCACAQGE